jgi:predicted nuclease with TOPRIM domain
LQNKKYDSETEAEIDKLTREEALSLLKELSMENQELLERAESLDYQLKLIADKVDEIQKEKEHIETSYNSLRIKYKNMYGKLD